MIVTGDAVCHYVTSKTNGEYFGGGVGFGIEKDGQIVCGVMFERYAVRSLQIHVAKESDARMTKEWFKAFFGYAFNQVKINKLIGAIDSTNIECLRFTRHLGFVDECVIKDASANGDICVLTMVASQCKFLRTSYAPT